MHFFDGIHKSDLTDLDKARELYVKALDEDPFLALVAEAIEEIDSVKEKECKSLRNKILRNLPRSPRRKWLRLNNFFDKLAANG